MYLGPKEFNFFKVSDSYYKMEFETRNQSIFDIYQIANWEIEIINNFDNFSQIDLIVYFNELQKYIPWLYPKEIGIRSEKERIFLTNSQAYIDYMRRIFSNEIYNEGLEWDIGFFECGLKLQCSNKEFSLNNKKESMIYVSFDPDYKKVTFSLNFGVDLFTANPSRQPGVHLADEHVYWNIEVLKLSLTNIDKSGVFKIVSFDSEFHPKLITKYGFLFPNTL